MIVAAIILAFLIGGGLLLYLLDKLFYNKSSQEPEESEPQEPADTECCGMHITCEKDSLVAGLDRELLYYDDEELDAYRGRTADSYTDTEIEEFREVLLTLRPEEIAGWARSITTRGITLPADVRDELLLIVAEARNSKSGNNTDEEGRNNGTL